MTDDRDHDRYAHWAAPYTIGALDAGDRRAFEAHLADCKICASELAELAPLPGLIAKADPSDIEHHADPERAAAVAAAARQEVSALHRRSRRWQLTAAGLAVVVAALAGTLVLDPGADRNDRPTQVATVANSSASSTDVVVSPRGWGTEITLDITGLPARDAYELWTIDTTGAWTTAATWSPTPAGVVRLTGASRTPTDQIERIVITSTERDDLLVDASL